MNEIYKTPQDQPLIDLFDCRDQIVAAVEVFDGTRQELIKTLGDIPEEIDPGGSSLQGNRTDRSTDFVCEISIGLLLSQPSGTSIDDYADRVLKPYIFHGRAIHSDDAEATIRFIANSAKVSQQFIRQAGLVTQSVVHETEQDSEKAFALLDFVTSYDAKHVSKKGSEAAHHAAWLTYFSGATVLNNGSPSLYSKLGEQLENGRFDDQLAVKMIDRILTERADPYRTDQAADEIIRDIDLIQLCTDEDLLTIIERYSAPNAREKWLPSQQQKFNDFKTLYIQEAQQTARNLSAVLRERLLQVPPMDGKTFEKHFMRHAMRVARSPLGQLAQSGRLTYESIGDLNRRDNAKRARMVGGKVVAKEQDSQPQFALFGIKGTKELYTGESNEFYELITAYALQHPDDSDACMHDVEATLDLLQTARAHNGSIRQGLKTLPGASLKLDGRKYQVMQAKPGRCPIKTRSKYASKIRIPYIKHEQGIIVLAIEDRDQIGRVLENKFSIHLASA